ncbi:unnamed protein product [Microthlaspi erraticum]|uniref:Uncharacterized protein n=1 Tax=Microthlaspi erraticum TaxID=1685480 RepID=A0A6D2I1R2_9BRAS|nr:unnamed protein product [Microthlaspi erraticum]
MNSLQLHYSLHFLRPNHRLRSSTTLTSHFPGKINLRENSRVGAKSSSFNCFAQSETKESSFRNGESSAEKEEPERPPFDLAVILAGFQKISGNERLMQLGLTKPEARARPSNMTVSKCCLTVKGLTEKFKENDTKYSGSATFTYETFMLTVLPFLIA